MIDSSLHIMANCDGGPNQSDKCHFYIDTEANPIIHDLSQEGYQDWLSENGWLVTGELTYCPVCRYELHDL